MTNANKAANDATDSYFSTSAPSHGLNRDEDCMLKTALAYVLVRARQKQRTQEEQSCDNGSSQIFSSSNDTGRGKRYRRASITSLGPINSNLDRIIFDEGTTDKDGGFGDTRMSFGVCGGDASPPQEFASIITLTSSLLRRQGEENTAHLDHMFKTACSLAKTVLIRRQQRQSHERNNGGNEVDDGSAALIGATTHLAQQLKTLLLIEQEEEKTTNSLHGRPESKTGTSLKTLSVVVDFPITAGSQEVTAPLTSQTTPLVSSMAPRAATVTAQKRAETPTPTVTDKISARKATVTASSWIFASLKTSSDITDIRSSFFVYRTMIPYAGANCPALIGHLFIVTANMIRELYDDRMSIRSNSGGGSNSSSSSQAPPEINKNGAAYSFGLGNDDDRQPDDTRTKIMTLNVLAVESLRLLESCWLAGVPHDVEKKHRDFLLLTLQDKLGDLLVPLPLPALPCAYGRCSHKTATAVKHKRHQDRLQLQAAASDRHHTGTATMNPTTEQSLLSSHTNDKKRKKMTATAIPNHLPTDSIINNKFCTRMHSPSLSTSNTGNTTSSITSSNICSSHYLDPGAKLIMRLGVYKLLST